MPSKESVTQWLDQLREGDSAAARMLWERYFLRLVGLARRKLQGTPRRVADEEDVALSAFDSLCRGAEQGRFPLTGSLLECKAPGRNQQALRAGRPGSSSHLTTLLARPIIPPPFPLP